MFGCGQLIKIPRAVNVVRPRRSIRSGVEIVRKTLVSGPEIDARG